MNVLFLTLLSFESLQERNIYTDLLREFVKNGHYVYAISPLEKRKRQHTHLLVEKNAQILRLLIGNTQKTNILEKGISIVMMESIFKKGIKQYFSDVKFDLIIYSTPPITLLGAITYVKKRDNAKTYLLLKDIFPQNAVDIGMLKTTGIKGLLYHYFRKQEKMLYKVSDRIGCMSKANVDYVIKHNPEVNINKVELCPNSIDVIDKSVDEFTRKQIRMKYELPLDKKVFIYGGNLGKPQGIPFIIECMEKCKNIDEAYFLIIGDGTEYRLLESYALKSNQTNLKIMRRLPKEDYDTLVGACDVGLIFLDHRFTIPNFPSRLLSYMQAKMPVLASTDVNTDLGELLEKECFGWWCESNDSGCFFQFVEKIINSDFNSMKQHEWDFLNRNYSVSNAYKIIINGM